MNSRVRQEPRRPDRLATSLAITTATRTSVASTSSTTDTARSTTRRAATPISLRTTVSGEPAPQDGPLLDVRRPEADTEVTGGQHCPMVEPARPTLVVLRRQEERIRNARWDLTASANQPTVLRHQSRQVHVTVEGPRTRLHI